MSNGMNISFRITAIDDFSRTMSQLESSTQRAFDAAGGIGKALSVAGVAGAAGLGLAAKSAMDFESQLSSIKAVSGATSDEMAKLGDLAEEMGAKTKYSSVEAAQGIEELIKAGVSVTDIIGGGLEGALSLAVAGELELADAAEIASTALNAFKADGLDVSKAADILAGAANASATSVGELKFGLSMVSAVASGVGLSFADTSTALAVFAQNGLKGSDAGTSLKTMLLNLSPSTEEASEWMGELGLLTKEGTSAFYDASGSLKPLTQIAELLKTKLADLTDEQRQLALKTMFGTDAIRAANILYKEGAAGVEKMFGEMGKVTAVDVMNERMNNTAGALEELSGAFETLMISLGSALLPLIKSLAVGLQGLVGWFNGLSDGVKQFIAIGALVATLFTLLLGPILILVAMIPAITTGFTAIAGAMGVTAGVLATGIAIVLGVVAAIAALGVAFYVAYQKVDWFRAMVDEAWAWIKQAFFTALEFIKGIVKDVMTSVASFIGDQLAIIKAFWSKNGNDISNVTKTIFTVIKAYISVVMSAIKAIFLTVWPIIVGAVKIAWALIQSVITTALQVVIGIIKVATKLLQGDWKGAWEAIKETTKNIGASIIAIFKGINLREVGRNIIDGLVKGISGMIGTVKAKVKEIANLIPKTVKNFLGIHSPSRVLMELGEFTGQGFVKGIGAMVSDVRGISAEMAGAAVPSNRALSVGATQAPASSQAINLTLNYNGTGTREDADGMLDYIERGLNDRLGVKLRMNGVKP